MPILLRDVVDVAVSNVLPPNMNTPQARVELCAIAGQESGLAVRQQRGGGPAHSLWQFEPNGITAVLRHWATSAYATEVCAAADIDATTDAVYTQMLLDDVLGCRFARLLLWSDSHALPTIGDADGAWAYYLRNWRPGTPDKARWAYWYNQATSAVGSPIVGKDFVHVVASVATASIAADPAPEPKAKSKRQTK